MPSRFFVVPPPFFPPIRPILPKNSSPYRCLVVSPPLRPASARVIFRSCIAANTSQSLPGSDAPLRATPAPGCFPRNRGAHARSRGGDALGRRKAAAAGRVGLKLPRRTAENGGDDC